MARELVPNPKLLNPKPTPVHVVMPPRVGGGECRNSLKLMGYSSNSGVGSPFVGLITWEQTMKIPVRDISVNFSFTTIILIIHISSLIKIIRIIKIIWRT